MPVFRSSIAVVGEKDSYTVALRAGLLYHIELEGSPTGAGTLPEPFLRLFDTSRQFISSDDDGGAGNNARLVYRPTTTGNYAVQASGQGSATGTYRLSVNPDDFKSTVEGNGVFGRVAVGGSGTNGRINYSGDQDLFAVTLTEGRRYYIDLEGARTGQGTLPDPFLRGIYNDSGTLLAATSDDDGGVGNNARLVFTPGETGTYYVAAGGDGSNTGSYRLFVRLDDFKSTVEGNGVFGRVAVGGSGTNGRINDSGDQDLFAVTLTEGRRYYIDLEGARTGQGTLPDPFLRGIYNDSGTLLAATSDDDGGVGNNARLVFTPGETGTYYVAAGGDGSNTGSYRLFVRLDDFKSTVEGNGSFGSVAVGGAGATGTIHYSGDQDLFAVTLTANNLYRIEQRGASTSSGTLSDPFFRGVYDSSGTRIAGTDNDDSGGTLNSSVDFFAPSSGTYYLAAGAFGSAQGTYQLRVTDLTGTDAAANTATAKSISVGESVRNLIDTVGDVDWFRTTLTAGQVYVIHQTSVDDSTTPVNDPNILGIYNEGLSLWLRPNEIW